MAQDYDPQAGFAPFEIVGGTAPILLTCDHASNAVPPCVGGGVLGLPVEDMSRHIAYDVGARGLTLRLARHLDAPAVLSRFSRLVIDPNRAEDDPTLLRRIYDGSVIPANRHAGPEERARRVAAFHRPYHSAITERLNAMVDAGQRPVVIAIHSFTPRLRGQPMRPWHIGLLWDSDARLLNPLKAALEAAGDIVVGDNEPYTGRLAGDAMFLHGTSRALPHILIEVRNDLIETPEGQDRWADRLAAPLQTAIATLEHE